MRTPLEDGKVTISRVASTLTYPCHFMFVASMNPCPCGYYGSNQNTCTCSMKQISNYRHKLSGPLLDRMDIHIEVKSVKYTDLASKRPLENSASIKKRVNIARKIQNERYKPYHIFSNSQLTPALIQKYCQLSTEGQRLLENAYTKLGFSARAHDRILKVARTIADLEQSEIINISHIAEAIQYRSLDRKYFD